MSKPREFIVSRPEPNVQLGCSALVESLRVGESVLFREVLPDDIYQKRLDWQLKKGFRLSEELDRTRRALEKAKETLQKVSANKTLKEIEAIERGDE